MSSHPKVSVIFGTRPEAIKLAPVIRELRKHPELDCRVCVTAQHRQMLDQVLQVFRIAPDHDLALMQDNQTLADFTARALTALDRYLREECPDLILIQGDTTTVLCSALAAFYHKIPIAHVEAGLRTGDLYAPWPEEANRVLTSRLATLHFAPTESNRRTLLREGVPEDRVFVTGNPVVDALLTVRDLVRQSPPRVHALPSFLQPGTPPGCPPMVLITGHRRESFGAGFEQICQAIRELARRYPDSAFVYPVHLNPNVRKPVYEILSGLANVYLIEPLPYLEFVGLMDRATLILTDSGGVQEEAPSLGKPVLVMREKTERPEGVHQGVVRLVGTDRDAIVSSVSEVLDAPSAWPACSENPYGDGHAAERIVMYTARFLNISHVGLEELPRRASLGTSSGSALESQPVGDKGGQACTGCV